MGRISDQSLYGQDPEITGAEYLIGTNVGGDTLTYSVDSISSYSLSQLTDAEIKIRYERNPNTNAFTDALLSKLQGIEGSRFLGTYVSLSALNTAHPSPAEGSYAYVDAGVGEDVATYIWDNNDNEFVLSTGNGVPLTPAQIKVSYESNPDTNAFTDAEQLKLSQLVVGRNFVDSNLSLTENRIHDTGSNTLTFNASGATRLRFGGTGNGIQTNVIEPITFNRVSIPHPLEIGDIDTSSTLATAYVGGTLVYDSTDEDVYVSTGSTWISLGSNTASSLTIQNEGINLPARSIINIIGEGITAVDDPSNSRTNVTVPINNIGNNNLILPNLESRFLRLGTIGSFSIQNNLASSLLTVDSTSVKVVGNFGSVSGDPLTTSSPIVVFNQGTSTTTTVNNPVIGTLIYDGPTEELSIYNGTGFTQVGGGSGGVEDETVRDITISSDNTVLTGTNTLQSVTENVDIKVNGNFTVLLNNEEPINVPFIIRAWELATNGITINRNNTDIKLVISGENTAVVSDDKHGTSINFLDYAVVKRYANNRYQIDCGSNTLVDTPSSNLLTDSNAATDDSNSTTGFTIVDGTLSSLTLSSVASTEGSDNFMLDLTQANATGIGYISINHTGASIGTQYQVQVRWRTTATNSTSVRAFSFQGVNETINQFPSSSNTWVTNTFTYTASATTVEHRYHNGVNTNSVAGQKLEISSIIVTEL